MNILIVDEPLEEPVTLEAAKLHLRVSMDDDDLLITWLIPAARRFVEHFLGYVLVTQTWDLWLDSFPACNEIRLPRPPLQSLEWLRYRDADGEFVTIEFTEGSPAVPILEDDTYLVDVQREPGRLVTKIGAWPSSYIGAQAVNVRYVAGYGDGADVPEDIKAAILLTLAHLYENRGDTNAQMPAAAQALLWGRRIVPL